MMEEKRLELFIGGTLDGEWLPVSYTNYTFTRAAERGKVETYLRNILQGCTLFALSGMSATNITERLLAHYRKKGGNFCDRCGDELKGVPFSAHTYERCEAKWVWSIPARMWKSSPQGERDWIPAFLCPGCIHIIIAADEKRQSA